MKTGLLPLAYLQMGKTPFHMTQDYLQVCYLEFTDDCFQLCCSLIYKMTKLRQQLNMVKIIILCRKVEKVVMALVKFFGLTFQLRKFL